jgi:hypothetical protein
MTQGNVIGEEFKPYVFDQIDVRQSLQGAGSKGSAIKRDPKVLNYLNNRNTWVKMASSVALINSTDGTDLPEPLKGLSRLESISTDLGDKSSEIDYLKYNGQGLAKNFVLFNTLSNFGFKGENTPDKLPYVFRSGIQKSQQSWLDVDSSYGFGGTSMGFQPTPGIIDVSIDCVNRGSIRKATVTLKAFNRFQFSVIEMLYLRLGYTMMLEWGWDKFYYKNDKDTLVTEEMGDTLIERLWFKNQSDKNPITQTQMISNIESLRDEYKGNYDGFFGKVNNFTWNFNPDGSYDITINLVTVGDVVESLKVNTSALIVGQEELKQYQEKLDEKDFDKESINYSSMGNDTISRYLNNLIVNYPPSKTTDYPLISYKDIQGVDEKKYGKPLPKSEFNYFMRLGLFLDTLSNLVIPQSSDKESIISIETNPETNYIKAYFNQIPFDPKVCLFTNKWGENFLKSYPSFKRKNPFNEINKNLPQKFVVSSKEGFVAGKLMNIYLNVNLLLRILKDNVDEKGNLSLYKLIESICNELNNALGGFNNLEPVIKDDKTLVIIDQNPIPGLSKFIQQQVATKDNPKIEVFGYNNSKSNFLKDIKFQTKIDNSLASMISIGATADGKSTKNSDATSFSKWNIGLKDRFKQQYKDPKPTLTTKDETATGRNLIEYRKNARNYALTNTYGFRGGKWRLPYSSTYPTTSGRSIIEYKSVLRSIEDVADFFVKDSEKAIKEQDIKTYEESEIIRITQNTYVGYLHDMFGVTFDYTFSNGKGKTDVNVPIKYNQLFSDNVLVGRGKSTFQSFINTLSQSQYEKTKIPSGNIGFIPVSFDLTLEGLSGVKIYNKLNIDTRFLPPNYGESLDFLITKVNHKISNNNWDTILGTISTSNISGSVPTDTSITGDFNEVILTSFSRTRGGITRKILGTTYTNGEIPDNILRTINNESKYKGSIQSDKGRIRLFKEASLALDKLLEKAESDGIQFKINSAYRTYDDQVRVKKAYGDIAAIPGTSNHGFGLAVDFATLNSSRISPQDPQYKWLVENGESFNFRRLNPKTRDESWESWHWEYQISTISDTEATFLGATAALRTTPIGSILNLSN